MSSTTLYHNPRCSKSRQTLQLLQDNGIEPTIVEYLKNPLSAQVIKDILAKLGISAHQLMRVKEAQYKELKIKESDFNEQQLIDILVQTPKLIERPIFVNGDKAVIGRPPENVLNILTVNK